MTASEARLRTSVYAANFRRERLGRDRYWGPQREVARRDLTVPKVRHGRFFARTQFLRARTPRTESTARRRVDGRGHLALDGAESGLAAGSIEVGFGHRVEQRSRVMVCGV